MSQTPLITNKARLVNNAHMRHATKVSKLSSLPKFKAVGKNRYIASCPAHDDNHPSLSITDAKDKVLVHCFSGCSQTDVIDALRSQGLWHADSKPDPWVFTADELEYMMLCLLVHQGATRRGETLPDAHPDVIAKYTAVLKKVSPERLKIVQEDSRRG